MKKSVKYVSKEKSYQVRHKRKLRMKSWFVLLVLPAVIFAVLAVFCLNDTLSFGSKGSISYNEKGNIDYRVYLKENDYYNKPYLDKGMQYIASLINTIGLDFNYEIHSTEDLDYNYKYKVTADLLVTDRNDSSKVVYERPETLVEEKEVDVTDNNFVINEDIDIDYGKYNEYVNSFKSDYALNVESNLIVTLEVITTGTADNISNPLNTNNDLTITIPLSEQTVDIAMEADDLDKQGSLGGSDSLVIDNPIILASGIVFFATSLILLIIAIYLYVNNREEKDIYEKEIKRILKTYDRLIVTSQRPNIKEKDFANVIRVTSIDELVDAYETTKKPIIYYEVIPGEKSFFVIINEDTLYKLTITKGFLQKEMEDKKKSADK